MTDHRGKADLIIAGGHVVTVDSQWTEHREGAVAVAQGRIVAVGSRTDLLDRFEAAETIDARGCLVLPGLIDAHLHTAYSIVSHLTAKSDWTKAGPFALGGDIAGFLSMYGRLDRAVMTEEESYAGARLSLVAALKSGTTCWNEGAVGNADGIARAGLDLGLRGIVTYPGGQDLAFDSGGANAVPRRADDVDAILIRAEGVLSKWNGAGQGRLRAWCMLASDIACSDELIRGTAALADKSGVGLSSHTCTIENEIEVSRRLFGRTGVERLADLGALGPRWAGIHMGYASAHEIGLMREMGGGVVHCPGTSMGVGKGVIAQRIIPRYIEAGIPVALGSDTTPAGTILDQMRLAFHGHKEVARDDRVLDPRTVLRMATITAAKVLGWDDEIGSLEAGKRADVTVIRCDDARWAVYPDPLVGLCRTACPGDVDTVVVDGQVLVEKGEIVGMDEHDVVASAKAAMTSFVARNF